MTCNTEHRIVVHRDGDIPTDDRYCVVFTDDVPRIAFHDGERWNSSDCDPTVEDITAWFYVEGIKYV